MDILAMLKICINTIASAVIMPGTNTGFILFLLVIYMQYKKNAGFQEIVYGEPKTALGSLMLTSVVSGIMAGIAVSIPMMLLGITFSQDMGIQYLIIISVLLMLIEPRLLCFSYSGGILALISLIFGLKNIDVTGIMMLVAVLHLLESILIFFDGHRGAVPVFLEREDGSIVGGFSMQRFWPIPIALILFMGFNTSNAGGVAVPDWWPLVKPYIDPDRLQQALFQAFPITAVLGYSEFTSSYTPLEKCRASSFKLALFSLTLLLLAVISSHLYVFKYIAALFAPIAHEAIIMNGKKAERVRTPIFSPVQYGVKVLDTVPGGAGEEMGMTPGDTIVSINNRSIVTEEGLEDFLSSYPTFIWVDVVDRNKKQRTLEHRNYKDGISSLGIVTVPKTMDGLITVRERKSYMAELIKKLIKR